MRDRLFLSLSTSYALNHIRDIVNAEKVVLAQFMKGLFLTSIRADKSQKLKRY